MTLYVAAYKGTGTLTDKLIRAALSVRHGVKVPYSHVELLADKPVQTNNGLKDSIQRCIGASKRDNYRVRAKPIYFKGGNWDFVELIHDPDLDVWAEAETLLGREYDQLGAILCVTPFARLHLDKEWCSGMIADLCDWDNPESYDPYMVFQKALSLGGFKVVG
jgi:hypothetical protein